MGHSVSKAADNAVQKSKVKEEKKNRTDAQVFVDVEKLLDAHLSVPPADIRLLLTRLKETVAMVAKEIIDNRTDLSALDVAVIDETIEEKAKAELDKAQDLLLEIAQNPKVVEELEKTGYKVNTAELEKMAEKKSERELEKVGFTNEIIDPIVEQVAKELMTSEGGLNGSQEETTSRTEERSVEGSVDEIQKGT